MKSFSGATTQDMKSYIQPTIDNAPDRICLHIGTNDLKSKAPDDIANAIVDLAKTIQSTCGAEVVLSELTTRKDAHKESVKSVNKLPIKYSKQHQWSLVRHSNITEKVLNRGGLHLTKQGNELPRKLIIIELFPRMPIVLIVMNLISIATIIAYRLNQFWISRDPLLTITFLQNEDLS